MEPKRIRHTWLLVITGFAAGIFIPVFSGGFIYTLQGSNYTWNSYMYSITHAIPYEGHMLFYQLGVTFNIGLFFLIMRRNYLRLGRGFLMATVAHTLYVMFIFLKQL